MAPTATFTGRYARYKKGTDTLLDWLARTASTCCDISGIVASLQAPNGKRKHARNGTEIILRTVELARLALAIANADPAIPTPLSILETVRDVIHLRQDVAADYATDSMERYSTLSESDRSHQHFIAVLQQVHDILEPSAMAAAAAAPPATSSKRKKAMKKDVATSQGTANSFAGLQIEEPQEVGPIPQATATSTKLPDVDYTRTTFKLDKKEEQANFAIICHLQDLHDVRIFVKQAWAQYSRGEVSLVYASMVTEVALGLLRCADDQFTTLNPKFEEYHNVVEALGVRFVKSDVNLGIMFVLGRDAITPIYGAIAGLNLPELLCPQAFFLLQDYIKYQHFMADRRQGSKTERPAADVAAMESWRECHPFAKALMDNALGILLSCSMEPRLNEVVKGLQRCSKEGKIWTWLAVACQTYMDVVDILEGSDNVGIDTLKSVLQDCLGLEQPTKAFFEETTNRICGGGNWAEWMSSVTREVRKAQRQIDLPKDAYLSGAVRSAKYTEQKKRFIGTLNRWTCGLESVFPTLAGGSVFWLNDVLLWTGCENANHPSLAIHSVAYLYKLCRRLGLISKDWPDMEFMIASQASVGPLVPKLAADCKLERYLEAFKAATGLRPDVDERLNRATSADVYGKGTPIKVGAEFCGKFVDSVKAQKTDDMQISMGKIVEIILHDIAYTTKHKKAFGKKVQRHANGSGERELFSPVELLTAFQTSFLRDEPMLNFDYFRFMLHCHQLCGEVADAIASSDMPIPGVQLFRLKETADRLQDHPECLIWSVLLSVKENLTNPDILKLSLWPAIASALEKAIEGGGKQFVKAANDRSSGHIPKSLRPDIGKKHAEWLKSNDSKASLLKQAGSRVAFSGKIITLSHPKLTLEDLNNTGSDAGLAATFVPGYMVSDGAGGHQKHPVLVTW